MKDKTVEGYAFTLKNDYAFKLLLGVEKNKQILQDFLECVLDLEHDEIEGLELLDKELKKDHPNDKAGILDIRVRLKNGTLIDVEMQQLSTTTGVTRGFNQLLVEYFVQQNIRNRIAIRLFCFPKFVVFLFFGY